MEQIYVYLLKAHVGRTCSDVLEDKDLVYQIANHTFPRFAKELISHPVWEHPTTTAPPPATEPNTVSTLAPTTETLPYDYGPLNFEVGPREPDGSSSLAAEPEASATLTAPSG